MKDLKKTFSKFFPFQPIGIAQNAEIIIWKNLEKLGGGRFGFAEERGVFSNARFGRASLFAQSSDSPDSWRRRRAGPTKATICPADADAVMDGQACRDPREYLCPRNRPAPGTILNTLLLYPR